MIDFLKDLEKMPLWLLLSCFCLSLFIAGLMIQVFKG